MSKSFKLFLNHIRIIIVKDLKGSNSPEVVKKIQLLGIDEGVDEVLNKIYFWHHYPRHIQTNMKSEKLWKSTNTYNISELNLLKQMILDRIDHYERTGE